MALIKLNLTDIGPYHVPVVYDSVNGVIEQDPSWVAANAPGYKPNPYGPGDVFLAPDGRQVDYNEAFAQALALTAPKTIYTSLSQVPGTPQSNTQSSGQQQTNTPAVSGAMALQTTVDQLIKRLEKPIWPDDPNSVSTGVVLGGAVLIWMLFSRKKRR